MTSDPPSVRYELLSPETVEALQECIRRTYGETYPFRWLYDRAAVEMRLREGWLVDAIARASDGRVVGTIGLLLASPHNASGDYTADSLAAMVDPDFRGHDVMLGMGAELYRGFRPYGLAGIHLYALALHDVVQRKSTASGDAQPTGVLPSYFDRDVRVAGFDTGGRRVGAVMLFQPVANVSPRRAMTLPTRYAEPLREIYDRLPLPRDHRSAHDVTRGRSPLAERSACEISVEPANREAKLRVRRTGADLARRFDALIARGVDESLSALYVDLALDDAAIDVGVAAANAAGFSFGALVPERFHTDWLRLQRFDPSEVSLSSMVVAGDAARRLLALVKDDGRRPRG